MLNRKSEDLNKLSKNNCKTTNQDRKGNDKKWENLNFIVIHESKGQQFSYFKGKFRDLSYSDNRPRKNKFFKNIFLRNFNQ